MIVRMCGCLVYFHFPFRHSFEFRPCKIYLFIQWPPLSPPLSILDIELSQTDGFGYDDNLTKRLDSLDHSLTNQSGIRPLSRVEHQGSNLSISSVIVMIMPGLHTSTLGTLTRLCGCISIPCTTERVLGRTILALQWICSNSICLSMRTVRGERKD